MLNTILYVYFNWILTVSGGYLSILIENKYKTAKNIWK